MHAQMYTHAHLHLLRGQGVTAIQTLATLLLLCCHTVVTLLLHCRNIIVTLLSHCCYTDVTLLYLLRGQGVTAIQNPDREPRRIPTRRNKTVGLEMGTVLVVSCIVLLCKMK
jgi:ribose/xylose/arabinose/galactoside ABC-type transport system permease subunit